MPEPMTTNTLSPLQRQILEQLAGMEPPWTLISTVLRCNDCIDYHLEQCLAQGWSPEELYDALHVALVVGGSVVIPHLRHAVETIDLLQAKASTEQATP